MPEFPRGEMEEMVPRWLRANRDASGEKNWSKHPGKFYAEDATHGWNMGPNEEFIARGRAEICDVALEYQMRGFEAWDYPYHDIVIDDRRGTVVGFWKQIAPHRRKEDGTNYEVAGLCGSRFEYGGNFQWKTQRDFFDLGNTKAVCFELAGAGLLEPAVKKKIHEQTWGGLLPGHYRLRPEPSLCTKVTNFLAIVKIALFGR